MEVDVAITQREERKNERKIDGRREGDVACAERLMRCLQREKNAASARRRECESTTEREEERRREAERIERMMARVTRENED
jgi:hypothetical protein